MDGRLAGSKFSVAAGCYGPSFWAAPWPTTLEVTRIQRVVGLMAAAGQLTRPVDVRSMIISPPAGRPAGPGGPRMAHDMLSW
jgi:hypothetical protein